MSRSRKLSLIAIAPLVLLALSCATTPVAPTADPNLIDPRVGFRGARSAAADEHLGKAWSRFQFGNVTDAEKRFTSILNATPGYMPAKLGLAAVAIERNDLDRAEDLVTDVLSQVKDYFAADVYRAEIAVRRGKLESAENIYRGLAVKPEANDVVRRRSAQLTRDLFDTLFMRANQETDVNRSIAYLRQALTLAESPAARLSLVQKLVQVRKYEEARRQVAPLLVGNTYNADVEEALAEIDAGQGDYETAIARLEKLSRTNPSARHDQLLAEVKQKWIDANMPPQYNAAVESQAVTRSQLAVLLYWRLPSVRFAQNLAQPPIAIDIDIMGREELIRALALRFFTVDPITRQVYPERTVSASSVGRILARVLYSGGAPCAIAEKEEITEGVRAQRVLQGCGVTFPEYSSSPDADVSGRQVVTLLERVAAVLSSSR